MGRLLLFKIWPVRFFDAVKKQRTHHQAFSKQRCLRKIYVWYPPIGNIFNSHPSLWRVVSCKSTKRRTQRWTQSLRRLWACQFLQLRRFFIPPPLRCVQALNVCFAEKRARLRNTSPPSSKQCSKVLQKMWRTRYAVATFSLTGWSCCRQ